MATVATPLMTADEFYDFVHRPENRERVFELERGEIVEMSRPGKLHGFVCGNVARILGNFAFQRGKGYVCTNDTGVVVDRDPDTVRGPDVMFFEDSASSIDDLETKFGTKPARLAVEVLSPNDKPGKLNQRLRELFAFGTPLIWVIDPEIRALTIYQPGRGRRIEQTTLEESEEITGEDILPDFKCKVAEFFAMPGQ
jgi:Uma2 family endonuclease